MITEQDRQASRQYLKRLCDEFVGTDWDDAAWDDEIKFLAAAIAQARDEGRRQGLSESAAIVDAWAEEGAIRYALADSIRALMEQE